MGIEMWTYVTQNFKKIAPKGQISLNDFYKIRCGGGCPRSVPSRQTSQMWL